ncbi:hypothetical protein MBSPM3_v1c3910 [Maize bushy stunt phytoplasma]|uniref:DUF2963 domain-containing protein n=1 Tax=Maize bushy stunt phytoplasma TaxID=202462 RepID=A0ABN4RZF1_9MOLU|nr:hypothetical protein [Maize bushy stunt phytoplasma]AOF54898.1 hypothetical protein MBSPM3_v1c3910 [Maize bushy stunt phytoplasma]
MIRDNGDKEYYSLITGKLGKKIDKDDTIWEYQPNNGMLLKTTDKYHKITEYDSNGKRIKEILRDGVWIEYNPVNEKNSET